MRLSTLIITFALAASLTPAAGQRLAADLSERHISLSSNFTGTEIIVFGSIEGELDPERLSPHVVVTVSGAPSDVTVRRKERHASGIWINGTSVIIEDIPSFYYVASSAPLIDITSSSLRDEFHIGTDVLGLPDIFESTVEIAVYETFRQQLINIRAAGGTVVQNESGVVFRSDRLFRARIPMPPTVPEGTYTVSFYLFEDGINVAAVSAPLTIEKVGIEGQLTALAHEQPFLYGILALIMAFGVGWGSTLMFRQN